MKLNIFVRCRAGLSSFAASLLGPLRTKVSAIGPYLLLLDRPNDRLRNAGDKQPAARRQRRRTNVSLEVAATVFSHAREGIMIIDVFGQVIRVNEAFTRLTGYSQNDMLGQPLNSHDTLHKFSAVYLSMKAALACEGHWCGEIDNRHKDGRLLSFQLSISLVRNDNGKAAHYIAIFRDVTGLKKRQQELERSAHYDALTQLPNRLLLAKWMRQAMSNARAHQHSLAVAFIDLDGFKAVNDSYGHELGDRVLQVLAQRIKATIREYDTLARLGGDEFIAGLVGLQQPRDCEAILQRMLHVASVPVSVDGKTVQLSASIGVAFFPRHGQEMETLIGNADQAMYASKRAGGSTLAFCA